MKNINIAVSGQWSVVSGILYIGICVVLIWSVMTEVAGAAVSMSDYAATPPFVSDVVEPNVLIIQSNGATMLNPAYCDGKFIRQFGVMKIEGLLKFEWKPKGMFCAEDMETRPAPPETSGSDSFYTGAQLMDLDIMKGGEINPSTDKDYYMFYASAGRQYTIEIILDPLGALSNGILRLYDRDGTTQIISNSDSPPKITSWSPPVSGYYYVSVGSIGGTGIYSLKITTPLSSNDWGKGYDRTKDYYGFFKADSEDDGDAAPDTRYMTTKGDGTYLPSIGGNGKFFRISDRTNRAEDWSGNFLNWLTMRRIDVARKALVGGRGKCDGIKCEDVSNPSFLVGVASEFPKSPPAGVKWFNEVEKTSKTKTEDAGYRIVRYVKEKEVGDPDSSPYTTKKMCYGVKDAKLYAQEADLVTKLTDPLTDRVNPVEYCHLSDTLTTVSFPCANSDGSSDTPCKAGKLYDMDGDGVANEYVTLDTDLGVNWLFQTEMEDETDEDTYGNCTADQVEACDGLNLSIDPILCACIGQLKDKHKIRVWVDSVGTEDLGVVQKVADKVRFGMGFFRKDDKVPSKNDGAEILVPVDFYNSIVTIFDKENRAYHVKHIAALMHQIMGLQLKDSAGKKIIEDKDGKPKGWSPLAEALWTTAGYFMQSSTNTSAGSCNYADGAGRYAYGANTATDPDPCGPRYYDVSKGQPSGQFSYYWAYQYGTYTGPWQNACPAGAACDSTSYNFDPYYFTKDYNGDAALSAGEKNLTAPCCKSFALLVTDANTSYDQNLPQAEREAIPDASNKGNANRPPCPPYPYSNTSKFNAAKAETYPQASCGSGFVDDIAYWAHITDLRDPDPGRAQNLSKQTLSTYILYTFGAGSRLLKDAAKYGGFKDSNSNNLPDLAGEWDADGNGVPDTYFEARTAQELPNRLLEAIMSILTQSASGTSVSVLATSAEGEGALYQAYFYPKKIISDFTERDWLGYVRGLFLDTYGNMREDTDGNGRLVHKQDYIVRMKFDAATFEVKADLFADNNEDGIADSITPASTVSLDNIKPIWEGGKILANRTTSRKIYTWLPAGTGGGPTSDGFISNGGTPLDFSTADSIALKPYLRAASSGEALNIISYARGSSVAGYRKRELDDGKTWKLGDIVYSTPTVVASPKEQYDIIYGSPAATYTSFRKRYKDRRQIVYVGSNDGMLHAFNAGAYRAGDDSSTPDAEHGWFSANPSAGDGWSATLGDELWAFVPYEALPHLAWLTCDGSSTNPAPCGTNVRYAHTYYVDLKPKITDARIFCDGDSALSPPASPDCVAGQGGAAGFSHPGGWGTVLIMGMRLGGGSMGVDLNGDGDAVDEGEVFRSAYYVFDITDPEQKPVLLWRFTDSKLGFATAYPAIAHIRGTPEKWFVIIGSGPTNEDPDAGAPPQKGAISYTGTSKQQGRIFVLNLLNGTKAMEFTRIGVNNPAATDLINSTGAILGYGFMGDPTVVDGNLDYTSDVIYIGSAYSTTSGGAATKGRLYRINTKQNTDPTRWELSLMFDQGQPLLTGPSATIDRNSSSLWIFFGTGRLWTMDDKQNADAQTLYGIRDACWMYDITAIPTHCTTAYNKATDLVNASDIVVKKDSTVTSAALAMTDACYYGGSGCLLERVQAKRGWYVNLPTSRERVLSKTSILGGILLATSFVPNSDLCSFQGDSNLYALYYETGAAYISPVVGTYASGGSEYISKYISTGKGMPTTVGIAVGKKIKGFIQTSTGTIVEVEAAPPLGVRSGPAGWREKTGGSGESTIEEIYKHIIK